MSDQLDLIHTSEDDVPQANSLARFIALMEAVHHGTTDFEELTEQLGIDERTTRYYVDLARWLGFAIIPEKQTVGLTSVGSVFAKNPNARSRLFRDGLFLQEVIQTLHALKREDETLGTKAAAQRAIEAHTSLSPSTAERRASSITALLEAAYKPSEYDWATGEKTETSTPAITFDGRAFLTTMAARSFGASSPIAIGFPRQVYEFVVTKSLTLTHHWKKAAIDHGDAHWFGSVPVNETTLAAAKRGGPDLRNLLALCVPAVTLTLSLLSWRDVAGRPVARITQDMYGIRVWVRGKDYGSPLDLVAMFARAHDLAWVDAPDKLLHLPEAEPGSNQDLLDVLVNTRFCHIDGTTVDLIRQFEFESREAAEGASSTHDRLGLIEPMWEKIF